ncbi:MAG: DMT family transporter [Clostridia bacterium]|nr:DMT family transporter [Clostridia bacterium]
MKAKIKRFLSPAILLLAAVIWGLAFVAQDEVGEVPAFTLGFTRSVLACVFLAVLIPVFDRVKKSERRLISSHGVGLNRFELIGGAVAGVFLALASALQQIGINRGTDGGKAAFITALYVVIVPIYALVLKKRAPVNVYLGVGIAAVGFYLLCIKGDFTVSPSDLLVAGCALLFPIQILAIDIFSPKSDGVRMSLVQFATASAVNLIFALAIEGGINLNSVWQNALPVVYLGIGSSGVAYTLQIIGQRGVDPSAASVILSLESVFGALGTAVILGQTLSAREYIGCAIVLFAVILTQIEVESIFKRKHYT